jgi:hypothetical protein
MIPYCCGDVYSTNCLFNFEQNQRFNTTMFTKLTLTFFLALCLGSAAEKIDCSATCGEDGTCTYTVKVDLFASELGYYKFEECGDIVNPTIAIEVGKVYRFVQVSDNDASYSMVGSRKNRTHLGFPLF